jgi:type IV pilus biogenesis protein CpaD/CtpE
MRDHPVRSAAVAAVVCLLGACNEYEPETSLVQPPDYSPHYTHLTVVNERGRTKRVLVPEACLIEEDARSPAQMGPRRLPSGCANAYNLQRMAERKRDLTHGRSLGAAPAAPATRAAQKYLDGRDTPALGGAFRDETTTTGGTGTSQQQ